VLILRNKRKLFRDGRLGIKGVSYQLGCSEVSGFSIAFKKYFGESPSECRHKLLASVYPLTGGFLILHERLIPEETDLYLQGFRFKNGYIKSNRIK